MDLGAFSVSLSVKDIAVSRAFYEALGFTQVAGNQDENWLIMRNGATTIGLFHGMFDGNLLTFNPGWSAENDVLDSFIDVREFQRRLQAGGIELGLSVDEQTSGPAHITLVDPDGNAILIDQHV
jgi:catechol 2,3-dioxygenase-like lactoylglutathione lyase family enzyme